MNEFEILAAYVRIFEKGLNRTFIRLRTFDRQVRAMAAGWKNLAVSVTIPPVGPVTAATRQLASLNRRISTTAVAANAAVAPVRRLDGAFKSMVGTLGALRGLLGLFAVGFIARITSEFEKLNLRLLAFTRNQETAKRLFDDLLEFSGETFFDVSELSDAAAQMLNMGIAIDSIIPSLRVLNDIAIATNRSIADVSFPLIDIAQKQKANARDLIQFAIRGVPIYRLLGEVTGVFGNELERAISEGKIGFEDVTAALQRFSREVTVGSAAAESSTAKFRQAFNSVKVAAAALGDTVAPLFTTMLQGLGETTKATAVWLKELQKVRAAAIGAFGEVGDQAAKTASLINRLFKPSGVLVAKEFNDRISQIVEQEGIPRYEATMQAIREFWRGGFKKAGEEAGEAFARESANAIQEAAEEIDLFKEYEKQAREAVNKIRSFVFNAVLQFGQEQFNTAFPSVVGGLAEQFKGEFDKAKQEAARFAEDFATFFQEAIDQGFNLELSLKIAGEQAKLAQEFRDHARSLEGRLERALETFRSLRLEAALLTNQLARDFSETNLVAAFQSAGRLLRDTFFGPLQQLAPGGLAGAVRAGSIESLRLSRNAVQVSQQQLAMLTRIEENPRIDQARAAAGPGARAGVFEIAVQAISTLPGL